MELVDWLLVAGVALIVAGSAMLSIPVAVIVLGAIVLLVAILAQRRANSGARDGHSDAAPDAGTRED